jgi:hypothetical protein
MSDIIYYKNGEETFRISPPTVGTKCPETKLEVKKMTEIEKIEGEIKVLQAKLELLKEMEKHKTPVEEAYKRWYPSSTPGVSYFDDNMWSAFQKGYNSAQQDYKVGEYQPTPQEPEELKTLHQMMYDEEWCKSGCDEFCDIVKRWLSQYEIDGWEDDWEGGFSDCLDKLNKGLK